MSEFAIKEYLNEVEKIIHFGGTNKETAIRNAFYNLLNDYAKQKGLMIVTEIDIKATNSNKIVTPDGTLKDVLRQDWGYWESKDESDNLDEEIRKKFEKGYPKENILFEDSQTAVLIQNGVEELRVPRIPFYDNFNQWATWGKALMNLHINYESADPYLLERVVTTYEVTNSEAWETISKPKLKADKIANSITIDGFDRLCKIPPAAWEYRLGNRSALEWVLDQYKEGKPKDPTIAEKFNSYKFADHKDHVIDLLKRVCTVSVETMKIVREMESVK